MFLRLLTLPILVLLLFTASRALIRSLPGDPLETVVAESGTTIPTEELRIELGLNQTFLPALSQDLSRALQGDFGRSLFNREPIAPELWRGFLKTLTLVALSLLLTLSFSLPLGLAAARGGLPDTLCTAFGSLTSAFPIPWVGPIVIYLFSVAIPLFPVGGHVLPPAAALSLLFAGFWSRLIRSRVRESLRLGAAPGARARGIPEWKVLLKYGLAPCSGSLIAYFGSQFGGLLAGAFVTEVIFDWHGMGMLLVDSILRRDYPMAEAAIFVGAAVSLFGTALGDLGQMVLLRRKGEVP